MIATLLCAKAGLAVAPLIIVAVVIAYLTTEALTAFADSRAGLASGKAQARVETVPSAPQRVA